MGIQTLPIVISVNIFSFTFHYSNHQPPSPNSPHSLTSLLNSLGPLCRESLCSNLCTIRVLPMIYDLVQAGASSTIIPLSRGEKNTDSTLQRHPCTHLPGFRKTPGAGSMGRGTPQHVDPSSVFFYREGFALANICCQSSSFFFPAPKPQCVAVYSSCKSF